MKDKRWTKAGRDMRKEKPNLFSGGSGKGRHFKGGAHKSDTDYNRADVRRQEKRVERGDYED